MKLKELSYFFECYNFPSLRFLYPTNDDLWKAFNKQEGRQIRIDLSLEIEWVKVQNLKEQKQIMKYLNQVGIMGVLRFENVNDLLEFLEEMQKRIGFF